MDNKIQLLIGFGNISNGMPPQIEALAISKHRAAWDEFYGPEPEFEYDWEKTVSENTKNKWRLVAFIEWHNITKTMLTALEVSIAKFDSQIEEICNKYAQQL